MIATGVLPVHIELAWPSLWPFLERAQSFSDDKSSPEAILSAIRQNACQGWLIYDKNIACAGICTKLLRDTTSGHLECLIWLVGGDRLFLWCPDFLSKLIPWAKAEGASRLVAGGRKGWGRWAARYGFEPIEPRAGIPYWARAI